MDNIRTLIRYGKRSVKDKLVIVSGGNISIRNKDTLIIKGSGVHLDTCDPDDYVKLPVTGICSYQRNKTKPSSEVPFHAACYDVRKDINAVIHVHPVFSTAVANSNIKLGCVSYELAAVLQSDLIRIKYRPSGSNALALEIKQAIKKHNAILMPNHGSITVGKDLRQAYLRAIALERACKTLIGTRLLGLKTFLPVKESKRIYKAYKAT